MSAIPSETTNGLNSIPQRLRQVAGCLDLFAAPAFLTDPCNRLLHVNQRFARLVGDPVQDRLPGPVRFIPAAMLGPYRERFPRAQQEIAQCLPSIPHEVAAGRLASGVLPLVQQLYTQHETMRQKANRATREWDGTVVIKDREGKLSVIREQVLPIADAHGGDSGFHVSLWLPADKEPPPLAVELPACREAAPPLTPRQLQLATWYAEGLTSKAVAARAGISHRTARSHLEHIYTRLGVNSRAELVVRLVRDGLV